MPSSSKDKKRKSSSPTHTTSSPSTAVLSDPGNSRQLKAMQVHYEGLSTRARMALAKITGWI